MYCKNCGAELMIGTDACLSCGYPVHISDDLQKEQDTTLLWLKEILTKEGFRFRPTVERAGEFVLTRLGHADIRLYAEEDLELSTFEHAWKVTPTEEETGSKLLEAINRANRMSRFSTFYLDPEETKVKARSCLAFTARLKRKHVIQFLDAVEEAFPSMMMESGLLGLL